MVVSKGRSCHQRPLNGDVDGNGNGGNGDSECFLLVMIVLSYAIGKLVVDCGEDSKGIQWCGLLLYWL